MGRHAAVPAASARADTPGAPRPDAAL